MAASTRAHPGVQWLEGLLFASVLPLHAPTNCTLTHLGLAAGSLSVLYEILHDQTLQEVDVFRNIEEREGEFQPIERLFHFRNHNNYDCRISPQVVWRTARLYLEYHHTHYQENAACTTYREAQTEAVILAYLLNQVVAGHDIMPYPFDADAVSAAVDDKPFTFTAFELRRLKALSIADAAPAQPDDDPLALLLSFYTNVNAHARERARQQHQRRWEALPQSDKIALGRQRTDELYGTCRRRSSPPLDELLDLGHSAHDAQLQERDMPGFLPPINWDVVDVLFTPLLLPPKAALMAWRQPHCDPKALYTGVMEARAYFRRVLQPAHCTTSAFVDSILNQSNPGLPHIRLFRNGEQELARIRQLCLAFRDGQDPGTLPLPEVLTPPPLQAHMGRFRRRSLLSEMLDEIAERVCKRIRVDLAAEPNFSCDELLDLDKLGEASENNEDEEDSDATDVISE